MSQLFVKSFTSLSLWQAGEWRRARHSTSLFYLTSFNICGQQMLNDPNQLNETGRGFAWAFSCWLYHRKPVNYQEIIQNRIDFFIFGPRFVEAAQKASLSPKTPQDNVRCF